MEINKDEAKIVLQGLENVPMSYVNKAKNYLDNTIKAEEFVLPADFKAFYDKIKEFVNDSNTPVSESNTSSVPDTETPTTDITDAEIV